MTAHDRITHYWLWNGDRMWFFTFFREFAEHGAKRLVLTEDLISLGMGDPLLFFKIIRDMKNAGITPADAHAPFGKYCDLSLAEEEYRPLMLRQQKHTIELCAAAGVDTCTFHLGTLVPDTLRTLEQCDEFSRRSLEELLPAAEKAGVILNIENVWFPPARTEAILKMIRYFQTPFLGVCLDTGHANLMDPKWKSDPASEVFKAWGTEGKWGEIPWSDQITEQLLPHIVTVHLHDNSGIRDEHLLPFEGTIDWKKMTSLLAHAPRLKWLHNEADPRARGYTPGDFCRCFDRLADMIDAENA